MAVHSIDSMLPASRDLHRRGNRRQLQVYVPCAGRSTALVQLLGDRCVMTHSGCFIFDQQPYVALNATKL